MKFKNMSFLQAFALSLIVSLVFSAFMFCLAFLIMQYISPDLTDKYFIELVFSAIILFILCLFGGIITHAVEKINENNKFLKKIQKSFVF